MANGWQMIKEAPVGNGILQEASRQEREDPLQRLLPGSARLGPVGRDLRNRDGPRPGLAESRGRAAAGRVGDPARGRQTVPDVCRRTWLPNHVLEPTSREKYTYYLGAFIFPALGKMPMAEIFPEPIREWITRLRREGRSAWTIQYCKTSILSSIFTTALNDQITYIHPCRGARIPTVPATVRTIVTPEQFDVIYDTLPDADTQLLVETAIESGLRWGELAELRVSDLDLVSRMLTVSRKVIEVNREFHLEGKRFLVKHYPKDKEYRRLKLSPQIVAKLKAHAEAHNLGRDSLLFARCPALLAPLQAITEPEALGFTAPAEAGRQYRHGTLSAYNAGKCRCEHCRRAFADYRAKRRATTTKRRAPADSRRRAHRAELVPPYGLAPGLHRRGPDRSAPLPRSPALTCVVVASWRRRPGGRQGTPRTRIDCDHPALPAHSPRCRRNRRRGLHPDPQPQPQTRRPPPTEVGVNPHTRKAALYAIAVIAILASANALAHSYAGLHDWAIHHRLTGWQAMSWPAEIDVFLGVGELAL